MLIVELENVKQNFCILCLQCSVNSLLLLVLAYLCKLRSYLGFFLALSAISVGPAFIVSEFDRVGGIGFAFDIFCITLLFLASQSLSVLTC